MAATREKLAQPSFGVKARKVSFLTTVRAATTLAPMKNLQDLAFLAEPLAPSQEKPTRLMPLLLCAVAAICLLVAAGHLSSPVAAVAVDTLSTEVAPQGLLPPSSLVVQDHSLVEELLAAALQWAPVDKQVGEAPGDAAERYAKIVEAIAKVSLDDKEKPLFPKDPSPRSRTAFFLLAQDSIESNLALFVEDGRCNSASWRSSSEASRIMKGNCDSGVAHGLAQMHVDEGRLGVVFDDSPQSWHNASLAEAATAIHGRDVIANREVSARLELHWERTSPSPWGSAPGAKAKMERWLAQHPLPLEMP
jgi:hypothetical protein